MALGDISTFSIGSRRTWSERIVASMTAQRTPEEIVGSNLFQWTPADHTPPRRFLRFGRNSVSAGSKKVSLTAVMNAVHDVQTYGTSYGIEEIAVPFPHVIFLTGFGTSESWFGAEQRIAELLRQQWQDLVDPLVELRVRLFVGQDTKSGDLLAFFGRGIFAPRRDERPIGRIEIMAPDGSASAEPRLPGGAPAGWYRGQAALAFSATEQLTPATCALLPAEPCRLLLRGAGPGDPRTSPFVLDCEVAGDGCFPFPIETTEPPSGIDAAFKISLNDGHALQVLVTEDARPSRILAMPPADPYYFSIAAVLAPKDREGLTVARWWIDLDRDLHLVGSALRPRALSVVCEDDDIEAYDWSSPGRPAPAPARLADISIPSGTHKALWAAGSNFGYLRAPQRTVSAIFIDPSGFAQPGSRFDGAPWELDWLDFAGAAETASLYAERLGLCAHKEAKSLMMVPGFESGAISNPGFLSRDDEDEPFKERWDGEWRHGKQLVVGPLLLRIIEAARNGA
jgi:hypothetical protein